MRQCVIEMVHVHGITFSQRVDRTRCRTEHLIAVIIAHLHCGSILKLKVVTHGHLSPAVWTLRLLHFNHVYQWLVVCLIDILLMMTYSILFYFRSFFFWYFIASSQLYFPTKCRSTWFIHCFLGEFTFPLCLRKLNYHYRVEFASMCQDLNVSSLIIVDQGGQFRFSPGCIGSERVISRLSLGFIS